MMLQEVNLEEFLIEVYRSVLQREPGGPELNEWRQAMEEGLSPAEVVKAFRGSREFRARNRIKTFAPAGHFYSAIVDPDEVRSYWERERAADRIEAIPLDREAMGALWSSWHKEGRGVAQFPNSKAEHLRFYVDNGNFPYGDAAVLRNMILNTKPSRIIEIGAGNSTACILDALDEIGSQNTSITCIEPNAERLKSLLRPGDLQRVELLETAVQEVPLSLFGELKPNDILFIDSTHVLKTGSDVHYELFHILPVISEGVLIQFHDCPYPFEYPARWVFTHNHSWNEAYALRAFLMYNEEFKVEFWPSYMAAASAEALMAHDDRMLEAPMGSGIWLRKQKVAGDRSRSANLLRRR